MPLPPPLKSSAAMRAASTEPMPLVSWKMPEMSLSTPTRTTLSEISAADAAAVRPNDTTSASAQRLSCFIESLPGGLLVVICFGCGRSSPPAADRSALALRNAHHETGERRLHLDLAGQPAVGQPLCGSAVEQRILVIRHRIELRGPGVVDIDVAGGAHGIAAAFSNDAVDAIGQRRQHDAGAVLGLHALAAVVGMNEGDRRHGVAQAGVNVTGRLSSPRSVLL